MLGSVFLLLYFLTKYFNVKLTKTISYSIVLTVVGILLLFFIFPQYLTFLFETFNLTYLEFTGQIRQGTTQGRTGFELITLGPLYLENFWIGTGYLREYFDAYGTKSELGLADFAVLGNLALYGTIGFFTYLIRYIKIHKEIQNIFIHTKIIHSNLLNNYELLLFVWAMVNFYTSIFFSFHNFSIDLVYGAVLFGLMIGIIYGLYHKIKLTAPVKN